MVIVFNCNASPDVEKAFKKYEIVQDISIVAPKKIVNVSFPTT